MLTPPSSPARAATADTALRTPAGGEEGEEGEAEAKAEAQAAQAAQATFQAALKVAMKVGRAEVLRLLYPQAAPPELQRLLDLKPMTNETIK